MNPKQTPETQAARARTSFTSRFGCAPDVVTLAPGRVNLIGDHVDYAGGLVMPIAIERTTAVAIGRSKIGHDSTFVSIDLDRTTNVTLRETLKRLDSSSENAFANYILGPLAILGQKQLELPEVNLVVASDVPMGGGLSSSAALEVAVLLAMRELLGERTDSLTLALEAQRAEHDFAGTPCGIMDMYVSAAAQANNACLIDCRDNSLAQVRVPSENDVVFLVTDTQTRHALADGAYAERRQACEAAAQALGECHLAENTIEKINRSSLDDTQRDAALHVVGETNRVRAFAAALADGELATAGTLMFESHESLATLFNVSCAELDLLVDTARGLTDAGVFGARMTGGGFGGSTITLCKPEAAAQVADHYATQFAKTFGTDCISFSTRPAAGARVEFQT